jgi:uncharacterized membrane protein
MVFLRLKIPNHRSLEFLIYNLFLAHIPLIISTYIRFYSIHKKGKILNWILGFVWLIFFPNAPYILTDGLHVLDEDSSYLIIDGIIWVYIMLMAFWIAILSIGDIELIIQEKNTHSTIVHLYIISIILISAYGIYLGRDLRLNSWDLILKPYLLVQNIYQTFANSSPGFFNWTAVFFYASIIYVGYLVSKAFNRSKFRLNGSSNDSARQQE